MVNHDFDTCSVACLSQYCFIMPSRHNIVCDDTVTKLCEPLFTRMKLMRQVALESEKSSPILLGRLICLDHSDWCIRC